MSVGETTVPVPHDSRERDPYANWDPRAQYPIDGYGTRDPYPELAELRRTMPVGKRRGWSSTGQPEDAFSVYRFDDVVAVLRDNVTFSSASIREGMGVVMGPYVLVGMDEPEHKRLRSLVAQAFRQMSYGAVRPAIFNGWAIRPLRHVHQDQCYSFTLHLFITARRGIALKETSARQCYVLGVEKSFNLDIALQDLGPSTMRHKLYIAIGAAT